jgi:hypothetical protein
MGETAMLDMEAIKEAKAARQPFFVCERRSAMENGRHKLVGESEAADPLLLQRQMR